MGERGELSVLSPDYSLSFWCRKGYSGTGGNKRGGRSMYEKKATSVVFICFTEEKRTRGLRRAVGSFQEEGFSIFSSLRTR